MAARKTSRAGGRQRAAAPSRRRAAPDAASPAVPQAGAATVPAAPAVDPEIAAELRFSGADSEARAARTPSAASASRALQEIATLLQLTNANSFKVRAYENAARTLAGLGDDLGRLLESGALVSLPGIGASIAEKVATFVRTGRLPYLDELRAQVPPGLLELLRIPGLGPKKALALHDGLEIGDIAALEAACRDGRIAVLRGFGAKTAENILLGIEQLRRVEGVFLWSFAEAVVEPVVAALRTHRAVRRLEVAGSHRRRKETVHDVDIVLSTDDASAVMAAFAAGPWVARVLGSGETKTSVLHPSGLQIDLRAVTDAQFPYALHHFTGSKEHNIAMRSRALKLGIKMNEYGLFRGDDRVPCRDEAEIFAALGLVFVPPELREDQGEIEAAAAGGLPARLIELADLRGAFHVHTTASDGRDTLAAMVRAARDLGWEWIGISDHGPGAVWAQGLDRARFAAQRRDIERVRKEVAGIRVLHGVEAEILPDGSLDVDAAGIADGDFVVAAVHSGFHLGRDDQTRRLVRAVENPRTTLLAHPTGRVLLRRPGYEVDLAAVLAAAARHGVAVEIDAHPQRMDLDGRGARLARDHGALVCISPDAHVVAGLADLRYGVGLARRGWLEPQHVVNVWTGERVAEYLCERSAKWKSGA
jgi:DNA polymerase (family 10)